MQTLGTIAEITQALASLHRQGKTIAFVPTMGNLHAGHITLMQEARRRADCVVASIFVNPLQFSQNEDLDAYPRTLAADQEKLAAAGVDFLFAPTVREMYPEGLTTQVTVPILSNILCGKTRPGHFTGVATICVKLFNIVQPNIAVFGEKDFQQLAIIKQVVEDLCINLEIIGVDTGRAESGLALSSRNSYLTEAELETAATLYACLSEAKARILNGERNYYQIEQDATAKLTAVGFNPDYFEILTADKLEPPSPVDHNLVIVAAAILGKARLIDNIQLVIPSSH